MKEQLLTRKWLTEEIRFLIMLATLLASIVLGYASLGTKLEVQQNELDTIKENHLSHLQTAINNNSDKIDIYGEKINEIDKNVTKILTILNQ